MAKRKTEKVNNNKILKHFYDFNIILGIRENIDINGTIYYIDTVNRYARDEAKTHCESLNMNMIRFETEEKWYSINRWLENW